MAAIQSSVITGGRLAATKTGQHRYSAFCHHGRCDWTALLEVLDPWAGDSLDLGKVGPRPRGPAPGRAVCGGTFPSGKLVWGCLWAGHEIWTSVVRTGCALLLVTTV